MKRTILIALLVPTAVLAGPRRKRSKKAAPPPAPTEPAPAEPAAATGSGSAAPTTPAPGTFTPSTTGPTVPAATTPTVPPGPASPAAAPAQPAPANDTPDEPEAKGADVDTLRQEYLALRDELFKSRARANAVASQLYSTRMTIKFTWGSARYYGVSKASIRLDGATVYEDASGAIAGDDGVRFDGYVAPGRHLVTFHVEATGKDDDSFTSTTESQVVVKAVAGKNLLVSAKGKDSGDIAYEWKRSEKGSYGLGIDVSVKTVAEAKK
jgi:hypothetical protein